MPDPVSHEEKTKWFQELCALQEEIAARRTKEMVGKTYTVLVEGVSKHDENKLSGRTDGNVIVEFPGEKSLIGNYCSVRITQAKSWVLFGETV